MSKPSLQEIKAKYVEDGEKGLSEDDVRLLDRYLLEYRNAGHHLETNKYLELTETWLPKLNNPMAEYKFRQKVNNLKTSSRSLSGRCRMNPPLCPI